MGGKANLAAAFGGRAMKASKIGVGGKVAGRVGAKIVGDAAKKAAGALGSLLGAANTLINAATTPKQALRKQTVSSSFGMVGSAGKAGVSGSGTMPSAKRLVERVSGNESTHELLKIAVSYLNSIDATLKAQHDQQKFVVRQTSLSDREKEIEKGPSLFQRVGGVASSVTQSETFNKLMKLALVGVAAAAAANLDQIDDLAKGVVDFAEQASSALSGAITAIGGVAAGLGLAGVIAAIKKGGVKAAKGIFKRSAIGVGVSLGLDLIFGGPIDGRKIAEYVGGGVLGFLGAVGGGMITGGFGGQFVGGIAGYEAGSRGAGFLYDKIMGPKPSATGSPATPEGALPPAAPGSIDEILNKTPDQLTDGELRRLVEAQGRIEDPSGVMNNPGGIIYGSNRLRQHQIGFKLDTQTKTKQIAVYDTPENGIRAAMENWRESSYYKGRTIRDGLGMWSTGYYGRNANYEKMLGSVAPGYTGTNNPTAQQGFSPDTPGARAQAYTKEAIDKMKSVLSKVKPTRVFKDNASFVKSTPRNEGAIQQNALAYEKMLRMKAREADIVPSRRPSIKRAIQRSNSAVMRVPNPHYGNTDSSITLQLAVYFLGD